MKKQPTKKELIDALEGMMITHYLSHIGKKDKGLIDFCCCGDKINSNAMEVLERCGRLKIVSRVNGVVVSEWIGKSRELVFEYQKNEFGVPLPRDK